MTTDPQSPILDSAVTIVETVLKNHGLALAEPVAAKFRNDVGGSTGIEVTVTLRDPTRAASARRAIIERLGGECRSDRLTIV